MQLVGETVEFDDRLFVDGESEWISGVLYPDHLGIAFTERLADLPQFIREAERLSGRTISRIHGTAAVASSDDRSLLGDWIENGVFQPDRLLRRFRNILGGDWRLTTKRKFQRLTTLFFVEIVCDGRIA